MTPLQAWQAAIEAAAKVLDRKASGYHDAHGSYDPSTGATEYPGDGAEWMQDWEETADDIRSLKPPAEISGGDLAAERAFSRQVQAHLIEERDREAAKARALALALALALEVDTIRALRRQEPTPAMVQAAIDTFGLQPSYRAMEAALRAALSAAPQPPEEAPQ